MEDGRTYEIINTPFTADPRSIRLATYDGVITYPCVHRHHPRCDAYPPSTVLSSPSLSSASSASLPPSLCVRCSPQRAPTRPAPGAAPPPLCPLSPTLPIHVSVPVPRGNPFPAGAVRAVCTIFDLRVLSLGNGSWMFRNSWPVLPQPVPNPLAPAR